ncbi:ABC-three component system middle component 1 [Cytophaga hutchinsonii]|uniref:Uncharacterized protein n=1 Tax=Cytophaga hutchinsonii (strain ATCC 33406 / DSM 1761 / CIP 103989 / NBRC 15051 / NCIMB 9469 / D465) TaxID=269798 RepID=A0A6N4SM56_CYTH3|nr:ABC-three component system middle component 1 [Cytophaga hutchinsonii]ABG57333.1 conserved hypothetical protein [Cytophaga hutchinsonii ATCC 33406]SFX46561.1 hypothetical protein SAMN04487930_104232 [Cytophaga hutchinsonii ATCC 33406]
MELFSEIEDVIVEEIKKVFELDYFSIGTVQFGGIIIVCMVKFKDETKLNSQWKEFNSYLTAKFIPTVKDDYSKWNFYVFYFSNNIVNKSLKYEIENNKFSSRKIVIDNCESITATEINNVISEHITNDKIQINVENKEISTFNKNASLANILDKLSLSKKNDEDMQNALGQIENIFKDEI